MFVQATAALRGLSAHAQGAYLLVRHPELMISCLPGIVAMALLAFAAASALWLPCLVLRILPGRGAVSFAAVLRVATLCVLNLAQALWPTLSGRTFFTALGYLNPVNRKVLHSHQPCRGLLSQLRGVLLHAFAGIGLLCVLLATSTVWIPLMLALPLLSPYGIAVLGFIAITAVSCLLQSRIGPTLAIFSKLRPISGVLAATFCLCALAGLLPEIAMSVLIEVASTYLLAQLHAKQVCSEHTARCNPVA